MISMTILKFKKKQVNMTLSENQRNKLKILCEEIDMTTSEWVRYKIDKEYYNSYGSDVILKEHKKEVI